VCWRRLAAAQEVAGQTQHDEGADEGAEQPAPVEDVGVADSQPEREDDVPDQRAARPKPSDTAQEVGPLMFRNTSPGISTRAITPQTNPSSRAPTMSTSSCENRDSS
jgi:hypothetical protein